VEEGTLSGIVGAFVGTISSAANARGAAMSARVAAAPAIKVFSAAPVPMAAIFGIHCDVWIFCNGLRRKALDHATQARDGAARPVRLNWQGVSLPQHPGRVIGRSLK
jgi:hypothetical protein